MELDYEIIENVELQAAAGINEEVIRDNLGFDDEDWQILLVECPDLKSALEKGRSMGIQQVTLSVFDQAISGNFAAAKFYLLNRDPKNWGDIQTYKDVTPRKPITKEEAEICKKIFEEIC